MKKKLLFIAIVLMAALGYLLSSTGSREYRDFSIFQGEFNLSISSPKIKKYNEHSYVYVLATVKVIKNAGDSLGIDFRCLLLDGGYGVSQGGRLTGLGEIPTALVEMKAGETKIKNVSWRFDDDVNLSNLENYILVVESGHCR